MTSWRNNYDPANPGIEDASIGFPDPKWCLGLNGASLACGFVGNVFLLFNFTRRIRYIVALPATIILWYFATGIVCVVLPLWFQASIFHVQMMVDKLHCYLFYCFEDRTRTLSLCRHRVPKCLYLKASSSGCVSLLTFSS